jgi:NAD(P)-dependent dehydrogenase (short-subunit alcohol dehydrogenase family)
MGLRAVPTRHDNRTAPEAHMTGRHANPVALVTGANRGIGLEVARQLGAAGFEVVLGSRDPDRGEAAAASLRREGLTATALQLDVSSGASVAAARDWFEPMPRVSTRGTGPALDVLVNNAAINYDTWQDVLTADLSQVAATFDTNTLGAWRTTLAFLPLLRRSDHPRVVNVSSAAGQLRSMTGGTPAYNLSKLALNGLTMMLAERLRRDRVLVNAVCPGWVATDMGGPGGRPVADGARGIVWAATLPDDGPTGGFFRDGRRIEW